MDELSEYFITDGRFAQVSAAAIFDPKMEAAAFRVLCAISYHVDRKSLAAWPAVSTLAEMLGVTRPAVQKQIRILERLGYVQVTRRRKRSGGNEVNKYVVSRPALTIIRTTRAKCRARRSCAEGATSGALESNH